MPSITTQQVFEKLTELERIAESFCEESAEPLFTIRQELRQAKWRLENPQAALTPSEQYRRRLAEDRSHYYGTYEDQVNDHYKSTRL